jgi:hypothetical protein
MILEYKLDHNMDLVYYRLLEQKYILLFLDFLIQYKQQFDMEVQYNLMELEFQNNIVLVVEL